PGSQTPPFKRKGKLSTIGKIFKPWKWRKKKTSEKFIETSAVLERKISTRQSREELIRRGVLKEINEQDVDATVNYEISNGHTIVITEEAIQEENVKNVEDNGSLSAKAAVSEEKKEDKKAISSNLKKGHASKSSSPSSTSSRSKPSKEPTSKTSTGTPRDKKKLGKQVTTRTPSEGDITSASSTTVENSKTKVEHFKSEESLHIIPEAGDTTQNSTMTVPPPPPPVPAPFPPSIPTLSPGCEPAGFSGTEHVPVSIEAGPSVPGTHLNDLHIKTEADSESSSSNAVLDPSPEIGGEDAECKIHRRDTLAIKLGNRPSKKELEDKNILQRTSEEERQELRHQIGTKLVRRLSQRPTSEELEQRNILKQKNEEEEQEAKRELKRSLSRKLSLRPTVAELQARRILRFNEYVEVTDSPDYDRRADKPWARLTPADKAAIRKELNEFKSTEMEVHEESRQFTR
uniref:Phosphatase and actin regulator n=1 Tax=Pseudonaja textilis TaxID=8673 RepID=A0A670XZ66_PSETE